jgi:hypothetical protein
VYPLDLTRACVGSGGGGGSGGSGGAGGAGGGGASASRGRGVASSPPQQRWGYFMQLLLAGFEGGSGAPPSSSSSSSASASSASSAPRLATALLAEEEAVDFWGGRPACDLGLKVNARQGRELAALCASLVREGVGARLTLRAFRAAGGELCFRVCGGTRVVEVEEAAGLAAAGEGLD